MIYIANITTLKDRYKTNLKKTVIRVTSGLVFKVEFFFPPGSAGLMGVAVFDGLYQVWPSTVGEFFIGEDQLITFDDMYLKESAPFEFQCYTYNEDDTNPHFVSVRIGLVSAEVFLARFMPSRQRIDFDRIRVEMLKAKSERAAQQLQKMPQTPFKWMLNDGRTR